MLRQGGKRIRQVIGSAEFAASSKLGGNPRSLSLYTAVPAIPIQSSLLSQSQSSRSSRSCSLIQVSSTHINVECWYHCFYNNSSLSRRWKSSNLHKRAAQALGKNMNSKIDSSIDGNDDKSTSSSSLSTPSSSDDDSGGSISSTQSVFSDMMKNASSAISNNEDANKSIDTHQQQHQEEVVVEEKLENDNEVKSVPEIPTMQGHLHEFAPRIVVVGVGGGGGNAVNNMIANQLHGVDFLTLNTDAQHLSTTLTDNRIQIGSTLTSGLGCGANPDAGRLAAEESREQITELLSDAHMVFITAGMGGGTGTGAAPVVAEVCYNLGILTVGVVTKPFRFEGTQRMRLANEGVMRLREVVDTLIVIPNQNLFHLANDQTSFVDSFAMADNVLLAGVKSITDLMTTPGLINLDFADVQSVMSGMGNAILGTGQSSFEDLKDDKNKAERAVVAAEMALANPLLGSNMDIGTAKGMLVNITGGKDMTLFEVDRAAQLITERVEDDHANIIFGSAYDERLDGSVRVSVVATGIEEYEEEKKV